MARSLVAGGAAKTVRARGLGIPFDGETGPDNAITDVAGGVQMFNVFR